MKATRVVREDIENGLERGTIGKMMAVRSKGQFDGLNSFKLGVYFVSGDVQPGGRIGTWAVSADAFRTGGGALVAVDPTARSLTEFGADAPVKEWGFTSGAEGYAESRDCLL